MRERSDDSPLMEPLTPSYATITTRDELEQLWLPWCVAAGEPSVPVVHNPSAHPRAKQVHMRDLDKPDIRTALEWQLVPDGGTSWAKIERFATSYGSQEKRRVPVVIRPNRADSVSDNDPVLALTGCRMLREASHRVAALYVAEVVRFELRLWISSPFAAWRQYETRPSLRHR